MPVSSIHGPCDHCGSRTSIHLVVKKEKKQELIKLFCAECLEKEGIRPDSSVLEIGPRTS